MSYRDPKQNSLIGEFQGKEGQTQRYSSDLINAIPVAIEGFTAKNVGSNTIEIESPQIINATNVDTETLLGDINLKKVITTLVSNQRELIETNLGTAGLQSSNYKYNVRQIVWAGTLFNEDHDVETEEDNYTGINHAIPSAIQVAFNSNAPFYVPVISTPGTARSVFAHNIVHYYDHTNKRARSLLLLSFAITVIYNDSSGFPEIKYISATGDGNDNETIFPGTLFSRDLDAQIDNIIDVEDSDVVTYDLAIDYSSGDYNKLLRAKVVSSTPGHQVRYKVVEDGSDVSFDNDLGELYVVGAGIQINRPSVLKIMQIIGGTQFLSPLYTYTFDKMLEPAEPNISLVGEEGPKELTITRGTRNDSEDEEGNTEIYYSVNGAEPHLVYDPDDKPILNTSCVVKVRIKPTPGVDDSDWMWGRLVDFDYVSEENAPLPTPIITPNGGIYFNLLPPITATMPSPLYGTYSLCYKWISVHDNVPASETWTHQNGWTVVTTAALTNTLTNFVNQWSQETRKLVVGFKKNPYASTCATAVFQKEAASERKEGPPQEQVVDDGFDLKLTRKKIEAIYVERGSFGTYNVVYRFDNITAPAVADPDIDVPESIYERVKNNILPAYSQVFFVTPTISRGINLPYNTRKQMLFTSETPLRKQNAMIPSSANINVVDIFKTKHSSCIYDDQHMKVTLNIYKSNYGYHKYCYSITDKRTNTETFPNNFSSAHIQNKDIKINRITISQNLDSGYAKVIVEHVADDKKAIAYLQLADTRNYYPAMSSVSIPIYLLNEMIIYSDGAQPAHPTQIDEYEFGDGGVLSAYLPSRRSTASVEIGEVTVKAHSGLWKSLHQKPVLGRVAHGNELAIAIDQAYTTVPTTLSFGGKLMFGSQYHGFSGVFTWKDGLERFVPLIPAPIVLPFCFYEPRVALQYEAIFGCSGGFPNNWPKDSTIFYTWVQNLSLQNLPPGIYHSQAQFYGLVVGERELFGSPELFKTGTLYIASPPAILDAGAYDEVQSTEEVLDINFIGTELVYGDKAEQGVLITDKGAYNSSYWPYMSDSTRRVSELGPYKQISVLENYIFTEQDWNACVYYVDEERGKNLLFNQAGKFAHTPLVYSGAPMFVIMDGNVSRLYKGTQEGILPIREEESTDSFLLQREGTSPAWYVRKGSEYYIYNIDTNSVSYVGKIASGDIHVTEIVAPGRKTHRLTATIQGQEKELIPSQATASTFKIESSDIYPSGLSYEYEKYTFIVNALLVRFKLPTASSNPKARVRVWTGKDRLILGTQNAPYEITLDKPEVIIPIDIQPASSIRYELEASVPLRGVRFLGHFIETLKGEQ